MKRFINAAMALALVGALTILFSHDSAAQQKGTGTASVKKGVNFVDQDGDGICDKFTATGGKKAGSGTGVCDGTGPKGNGTGMKKGNGTGTCTGTGVCDGTGMKGKTGQGQSMNNGKKK